MQFYMYRSTKNYVVVMMIRTRILNSSLTHISFLYFIFNIFVHISYEYNQKSKINMHNKPITSFIFLKCVHVFLFGHQIRLIHMISKKPLHTNWYCTAITKQLDLTNTKTIISNTQILFASTKKIKNKSLIIIMTNKQKIFWKKRAHPFIKRCFF